MLQSTDSRPGKSGSVMRVTEACGACCELEECFDPSVHLLLSLPVLAHCNCMGKTHEDSIWWLLVRRWRNDQSKQA